MRIHTVFSISLSMIVVGCAIRPLPKNVTRDTTLDISNKIRCETRDALVEQVIRVLEEPHEGRDSPTKGNMLVLNILEQYGKSEDVFCNLNSEVFKKNNLTLDNRTTELLEAYKGTSIALLFKFTISEQKIKTGDVKFKMPFTRGIFNLGFNAGSDKTRQNLRTFTVTDTFSSLLIGRNAKGDKTGLICDRTKIRKPRNHWIYPITGKIGMLEVVKTYVDLENSSGTVTKFSDTLTFTTELKAGVDPSVTISGITALKKLKFASAEASYLATRKDAHEVQISFAKAAAKTSKEHKMFFPIFPSSGVKGMPENTNIGLALETTKTVKSSGRGNAGVACSGSIFSISPEVERASIDKGRRQSTSISTENFLSDIKSRIDSE